MDKKVWLIVLLILAIVALLVYFLVPAKIESYRQEGRIEVQQACTASFQQFMNSFVNELNKNGKVVLDLGEQRITLIPDLENGQ